MAYKGYNFFYDGTRATFWGYIQTFMIEIGWELHDDISATVKVYKSRGESGSEPYGYVWIDAGTSTYIYFQFYRHWDAATHVGMAENVGSNVLMRRISSFSSSGAGVLAGNKDLVLLGNNIEDTNEGMFFGHIPKRWNNALAFVMGTAGTAGTLTVSTTAGFGVGVNVQIMSNGTAGCQTTNIIEMVDATTIKVKSLNIDCGTGSVMGCPASTFGYFERGGAYYNRWYQTSKYTQAGTSQSTDNYTTVTASPYIYQLEFSRKNIFNLWFVDALGYSDVFLYPTVQTGGNCFVFNNDGVMCGTSACTGTHGTGIIDGAQSWGDNVHTGRMVLIVSGTGGTQCRKVTGNDATSLTVDAPWHSSKGTPGTASSYVLCDVLYRCFTQAGGVNTSMLLKVTDTTAPA